MIWLQFDGILMGVIFEWINVKNMNLINDQSLNLYLWALKDLYVDSTYPSSESIESGSSTDSMIDQFDNSTGYWLVCDKLI